MQRYRINIFQDRVGGLLIVKASNSGGTWDLNEDGKLSFKESRNWWRNGQGEPIQLPLNTIDISRITPSHFNGIGSTRTFRLVLIGTVNDGLVHGRISLRLFLAFSYFPISEKYIIDGFSQSFIADGHYHELSIHNNDTMYHFFSTIHDRKKPISFEDRCFIVGKYYFYTKMAG